MGKIHVKGKRILLAEDNQVNRILAAAVLENAGFVVSEAENGAAALELARAHDFDLVLMDIQMPVMDGLSATRHIRMMDKSGAASVPILALTGSEMEQNVAEIFAAGMNDYLAKPFEPEALITTICSYLDPAQGKHGHIGTGEPTAGERTAGHRQPDRTPPCLDTETGIRQIGGNRALYREMLGRFLGEYQASGDDIFNAMTSGNFKQAVRIAHSVKGIAGVLGGGSLQAAARELEFALDEGSGNTSTILERFRIELAAMLSAVCVELKNPLPS